MLSYSLIVYTECTICFYDVVFLSPKIYQSYEQHKPLGSHPSASLILMLSLALIQQRHTKERSTILKPKNG